MRRRCRALRPVLPPQTFRRNFPARKSLRLFPAFLRLLWPVSRRDLPPVAAGKLSPVLAEEQENRLFFVRKAGITSCYSIFITRVRPTAPFFLLFLLFLCRSPPDQTKDGIFSIALSSSACSSASVFSRKNNTLFSGAISPTSGNQRKIYSSRVQFRE